MVGGSAQQSADCKSAGPDIFSTASSCIHPTTNTELSDFCYTNIMLVMNHRPLAPPTIAVCTKMTSKVSVNINIVGG